MRTMRKANRALIGGAMALNTAELMKPGANAASAMNTLQGGLGIGLTGIVTDEMFKAMETKRKRR